MIHITCPECNKSFYDNSSPRGERAIKERLKSHAYECKGKTQYKPTIKKMAYSQK